LNANATPKGDGRDRHWQSKEKKYVEGGPFVCAEIAERIDVIRDNWSNVNLIQKHYGFP
jgi:hypothetical protein